VLRGVGLVSAPSAKVLVQGLGDTIEAGSDLLRGAVYRRRLHERGDQIWMAVGRSLVSEELVDRSDRIVKIRFGRHSRLLHHLGAVGLYKVVCHFNLFLRWDGQRDARPLGRNVMVCREDSGGASLRWRSAFKPGDYSRPRISGAGGSLPNFVVTDELSRIFVTKRCSANRPLDEVVFVFIDWRHAPR
jgi:hypothetical protein